MTTRFINDKSGWCRTTESFVAVIVMVAVLGVLSFVEHRHQAQKTTTATTETPPPVATMTESEALQWLEACRDKLRQEKERADDAVIKYRATNQLDFLKSQYESLKLAHDLLLLDLAKAESRESNEVATADLVSLREKETENARVRAELQDRISKVEGKLSQLESARCLADNNLMFILKRIEEVRFSMKKETPMWE
jgi:hypothetical protein